MSNNNYLLIGTITNDIYKDSISYGGSGIYSSLTAKNFDLNTMLVTSISEKVDLSFLGNIQIFRQHSETITTFEHKYESGRRVIYLKEKSNSLGTELIPGIWKSPMIVHVAPLCGEIDPEIVNHFPDSFKVLTAQGLLRVFDKNGKSKFDDQINMKDIFGIYDIVIFSIEDIEYSWKFADKCAKYTSLLVVTTGEKGCTIYFEGKKVSVEGDNLISVDTTGAGDVFSTAYTIYYQKTADPVLSARIANKVAAHSLEGIGFNSVPDSSIIKNICLGMDL
tara:strand:- start:317 stop:1150 length:834 start_codon:yes stop_codon:yes gene_type:complete